MASSFNADGSRVITTGDDRTVRIWDTATATEIAALKGHTHYGRRACFSDGEPTAWSIGGNVLVWDIAWTEPRSGEALRDAVCATRLKGAERFSETEMQDPVLRGAPELRDA
jgi:WD40 repeat protein